MFSQTVNNLLAKHLPKPPAIIGAASLRKDIDELVSGTLPPMRVCVVDDVNTEHAFGGLVHRALAGKFAATHVTLKDGAAADEQTVEYIRAQSRGGGALIAVGSGTISDLCKYAAFLDHKPYIVFPTAASMNGYCSANASITFDGYKKTVVAQLPQAVFCDMSVVAAAPVRLSKSGLGDALARPTAQADWLLSHLLLNTQYNDVPFELIRDLEPELFDSARGIATSDTKTIVLLLNISLLSGFGMTIAGGSYPASQGEHMIAHTYEMLGIKSEKPTLHGEEIGVTTLAMAQLQQRILRSGGNIRSDSFNLETIAGLFGEHSAKDAQKTFAVKQARIDALPKETKIEWDHIRAKLLPIMLPPEQLEAILLAAQAPTKAAQLGWSDAAHKTATQTARYLRDRFTFLDID